MKTFKLQTFLLFATILSFSSCLTDPIDGDPKNQLTLELTSTDFQNDLVLENRNDGIDYYIDEDISMDHDLEIDPGVTIEFSENGSLRIADDGSLMASGQSDMPIVFTGEVKAKGSWKGILIESLSLKNQLDFCTIEYAGKSDWGNDIQGGLTTWADATLSATNCTFRNNKEFGFETYEYLVTISSFDNNHFEDNDASISVAPSSVHQLGTSNTFDDLDNVIQIQERTLFENDQSNKSFTWVQQPVPYRVYHNFQINNQNTLRIEAGVTIEFGSNGFFNANGGYLTVAGTENQPVTFTGVTKTAGFWPGISFQFTNSILNSLEYCTIEYAGSSHPDFKNGAIYMWSDPDITFYQCTFKDIPTCIFDDATSGTNDNLIAEDNTFINTGAEYCQ